MSKHTALPWGIVATAAGAMTLLSGALALTSGIQIIIKSAQTKK